MEINKKDTAVLVTNAQNNFLSEQGTTWGLVGDSVKENKTVENIERLFPGRQGHGFEVFISPHYFYPADHGWRFGGAAERMMLEGKEFFRPDPLSLDGFHGLRRRLARPLQAVHRGRQDGRVSPHKVWGPQTNDLVLQLRIAASTRSSWPECSPTSAWRATCAS